MSKILLVEDTKLFSRILKGELESRLGVTVVAVATLAAARQALAQSGNGFFLALLDLNLPDAPNGEVVDYMVDHGVPSVVFTGEFDDDLREQMVAKRVIDYVTKESPASLDYLISLIDRIRKNRGVKVLVVDDSRSARAYVSSLLKSHQFQVLEADSGGRALELLEEHRDVRLVLTDFNMPGMDGFELTKAIRSQYKKDRLAIIGLSAYGNNLLSARFIKNGANDFINKPFLVEEFHCRVTQNIEIIDYIEALKDVAVRDFLTGLHNRRYFFESGEKLYASARRGHVTLALAMLDVDFFKKVNDTYGHEAGDEVLKRMAELLRTHFRETDVLARFGGEEFCVLLVNMAPEAAFQVFDALRRAIEDEVIPVGGRSIRITASMGVCTELHDSLERMVSRADELLYDAKSGGRNRVVLDVRQD